MSTDELPALASELPLYTGNGFAKLLEVVGIDARASDARRGDEQQAIFP